MRLAIIITHPIRYYVPLFRLLTQRRKITLKAFYTYGPELLQTPKYDPVKWAEREPELPLFDGYEYEFVQNIARDKSTFSFKGINNPELIAKVKTWNPDGVLIIGWRFQSHLKAMRYFKNKIPVYFRGDSTLLSDHLLSWYKKLAKKIFLTWIYSHVNKVLYVGSNNKTYYKAFGLKEEQLSYAPHAVDNDRFKNHSEAAQKALKLRGQLGIGTDQTVFMFAGKFQDRKDPVVLLNAFLQASPANSHLVYVGAGPLLHQLKRISANHPNIHFLPFMTQSEMAVIYRLCNVFVLPSKKLETWGLVINEAMACGKAVIASENCGASVDLIKNDINGYILPVGNKQKLSEKIAYLAVHPEEVLQMGVKSSEIIEKFSYEVLATAIEQACS